MRVYAEIEEVTLTNEEGTEIEGVMATCSRCDHATVSFGIGEASIRRCLVLLRKECPEEETNFYTDQDE